MHVRFLCTIRVDHIYRRRCPLPHELRGRGEVETNIVGAIKCCLLRRVGGLESIVDPSDGVFGRFDLAALCGWRFVMLCYGGVIGPLQLVGWQRLVVSSSLLCESIYTGMRHVCFVICSAAKGCIFAVCPSIAGGGVHCGGSGVWVFHNIL